MSASPESSNAPASADDAPGPTFPSELVVPVASGPLDGDVVVPGSKSYTNRAVLAAGLAGGRSTLTGALFADDTEAMVGCVRALGATVDADRAGARIVVDGVGGTPNPTADLDARYSGTTARFVLAALLAGPGPYLLDAAPAFRLRPMSDGLDAVRRLGLVVHDRGEPGHLPVAIEGGPVPGGTVVVRGDTSSQFLSGLLLAGPVLAEGLTLRIDGPLVSRPYVELTRAVMAAFGATATWTAPDELTVAPGGYGATDYLVEPDASAASYPLAAAAIAGGRVAVAGLGRSSAQGDARFAELLARMGAEVRIDADRTEVRGPGPGGLQGIDVDMADCSDVAQTLAAVAVFADSPTTISGIGFIRGKETDRIGAMVTELRRAGIVAEELPDGIRIVPGTPVATRFETYEDHRMAMSLALIGLRVPGTVILDPGCVAKTYPGYFTMLADLVGGLLTGPDGGRG